MKYLVAGVIFLLLHLEMEAVNKVEYVNFDVFGTVTVYCSSDPKSVVLFVSGDEGWKDGVLKMAGNINKLGALVAGIDFPRYIANLKKDKTLKCYYPAGDFEELSMFLQKKYHVKQYMKPILMGYSSGATLVFGTLAQAPANTFKGAISLGFSSDLAINKPLCDENGLKYHPLKEGASYEFEPSDLHSANFIVLQGQLDRVCPLANIEAFMKKQKDGELVILPKVGHGFGVQANYMPQFENAYRKILSAPSFTEMEERKIQSAQVKPMDKSQVTIPVTAIPASSKDTVPLAFVISGDGGWTSFDQSFSEKLVQRGMPVVGLDAQKYFWNEKSPEEATNEISKALAYYLQLWKRESFILVGYSFGANVVPFVANRLNSSLKPKLRGVYMFSPSKTADFEIHISDMLSLGGKSEKYDVLTETSRLNSLHPVCIFGDEEGTRTRDAYKLKNIKVFTLGGDHHYNENFKGITDVIFNTMMN